MSEFKDHHSTPLDPVIDGLPRTFHFPTDNIPAFESVYRQMVIKERAAFDKRHNEIAMAGNEILYYLAVNEEKMYARLFHRPQESFSLTDFISEARIHVAEQTGVHLDRKLYETELLFHDISLPQFTDTGLIPPIIDRHTTVKLDTYPWGERLLDTSGLIIDSLSRFAFTIRSWELPEIGRDNVLHAYVSLKKNF